MIDKADYPFDRETHKNRIVKICELSKLEITDQRNKNIDLYLDMCDKYMKIKRDDAPYYVFLSLESRFGQTKEYWQKIFDKS